MSKFNLGSIFFPVIFWAGFFMISVGSVITCCIAGACITLSKDYVLVTDPGLIWRKLTLKIWTWIARPVFESKGCEGAFSTNAGSGICKGSWSTKTCCPNCNCGIYWKALSKLTLKWTWAFFSFGVCLPSKDVQWMKKALREETAFDCSCILPRMAPAALSVVGPSRWREKAKLNCVVHTHRWSYGLYVYVCGYSYRSYFVWRSTKYCDRPLKIVLLKHFLCPLLWK